MASVQIADDAHGWCALISQHSLSDPDIIARVVPSSEVQSQIGDIVLLLASGSGGGQLAGLVRRFSWRTETEVTDEA